MENNKKNFFWVSYVDLMTALFAVVLVLFILSFKQFDDERKRFRVKEAEYKKIEEVKKNLEVLMNDSHFFIYEKEFKRYRLAQEITFKTDRSEINESSVVNYERTKEQLTDVGKKLKNIIDSLKTKKQNDTTMKELSYLMIISGRSSRNSGTEIHNYTLSYSRALSLYNFWKNGPDSIDFDNNEYQSFLDFQIAGNGIGGIGRIPNLNDKGLIDNNLEILNQSFLIQIIPKIGEIDTSIVNSKLVNE